MDVITATVLDVEPDLVVYAREPLESGDWTEKMRLIDMHAVELRGMVSDLQLTMYRRLEEKRRLVIVTARRLDTGELVGYSSHIWYDDLHFSVPSAEDDAWFVVPHYRGYGIGRKLREKAHEELRRLGVRIVTARLKVDAPHDTVIAELGYRHWENIYRLDL